MIQKSDLCHLLEQHLTWYPLMQVEDIYKLIYQGAMGSGHSITSSQEFIHQLNTEYASLQPAPDERPLETVRPDHTLLRLNLRPYKANHLDTKHLIPLLIETSRQFTASAAELVQDWNTFIHYCEQNKGFPFKVQYIRQFTHWLEKEDYPAIHHSPVYRHNYQPSYRLIGIQFVTELGLTHAG
jgi:hypothetical protein